MQELPDGCLELHRTDSELIRLVKSILREAFWMSSSLFLAEEAAAQQDVHSVSTLVALVSYVLPS